MENQSKPRHASNMIVACSLTQILHCLPVQAMMALISAANVPIAPK